MVRFFAPSCDLVSLPETIARQVFKRQLGCFAIVVLPDQGKIVGEPFAEGFAPRYTVRASHAGVDQIEHR
jgi:hypothetical protein